MSPVARKFAVRSHAELRGERRAETFEGRRERRSRRLTEFESSDLQYLWQSYASDLGVKSAHGLIERHILLMAPPRDVQRPVLEELAMAGGRAPEGRVMRIVVFEGLATRREIRLAVECLTRTGKRGRKVERIPVPRPEPSNACEGKCDLALDRKQRACAACEWTGYDLRLTERGEIRLGLALRSVPMTRAERRQKVWDAKDDALRREWQTMEPGAEGVHAPQYDMELMGSRQRKAVDRAIATLSLVSHKHAVILHCWLGRYHANENALLDAVRRFEIGASRERAKEMLEEASDAYRAARRSR